MKKVIEKVEGMNFKKAFILFFAALAAFGVIFAIVMVASGNAEGMTALWERLTFDRLRGRMFTDIQGTFRFFGYLFLVGFNALLALWVYVDSKKNNGHKALWPALTLLTGLIGWLVYMIKRVDRQAITNQHGN
ncbi:MAG: hypothetical protein FWE21_05435 [Defluviitaleaceae bacterium]|nr:hypothetical protein [Defluviitaleaceae bacterium]